MDTVTLLVFYILAPLYGLHILWVVAKMARGLVTASTVVSSLVLLLVSVYLLLVLAFAVEPVPVVGVSGLEVVTRPELTALCRSLEFMEEAFLLAAFTLIEGWLFSLQVLGYIDRCR